MQYCPCMCLSLPTDSLSLVDRAVLSNNATLSMHALYPLAVYVLWINLCFLTMQQRPYTLSNIDCPYLVDLCYQTNPGGRGSPVVRAPDSWLKGYRFKSLQERWENFLLQGQLCVLTLISLSVPPSVTAVARQRSQSFCQKCRWQLNTHTPYVCGFAWSDMVHGYMVYRELAPRWQQFHVAPAMSVLKYTTSVDVQKCAIKS